jgi:hypothetical protein
MTELNFLEKQMSIWTQAYLLDRIIYAHPSEEDQRLNFANRCVEVFTKRFEEEVRQARKRDMESQSNLYDSLIKKHPLPVTNSETLFTEIQKQQNNYLQTVISAMEVKKISPESIAQAKKADSHSIE